MTKADINKFSVRQLKEGDIFVIESDSNYPKNKIIGLLKRVAFKDEFGDGWNELKCHCFFNFQSNNFFENSRCGFDNMAILRKPTLKEYFKIIDEMREHRFKINLRKLQNKGYDNTNTYQ